VTQYSRANENYYNNDDDSRISLRHRYHNRSSYCKDGKKVNVSIDIEIFLNSKGFTITVPNEQVSKCIHKILNIHLLIKIRANLSPITIISLSSLFSYLRLIKHLFNQHYLL